jgi:hypothetical protein
MLVKLLCLETLSIVLFLLETGFGDWVLSASLCKNPVHSGAIDGANSYLVFEGSD